jgi:hypothetical protein
MLPRHHPVLISPKLRKMLIKLFRKHIAKVSKTKVNRMLHFTEKLQADEPVRPALG